MCCNPGKKSPLGALHSLWKGTLEAWIEFSQTVSLQQHMVQNCNIISKRKWRTECKVFDRWLSWMLYCCPQLVSLDFHQLMNQDVCESFIYAKGFSAIVVKFLQLTSFIQKAQKSFSSIKYSYSTWYKSLSALNVWSQLKLGDAQAVGCPVHQGAAWHSARNIFL